MLKLDRDQIDIDSVNDVVDDGSFARGVEYARQQAVRGVEWDAAEFALHGVVRGGRGQRYETTVFFEYGVRPLLFDQSQCSCPVGVNCKHAVAMVFAVTAPEKPKPLNWEQLLSSVLEQATPERSTLPLAIELLVGQSLSARLVRQGRHGWVNGGLRWSSVGNAYQLEKYQPAHVGLLGEMHAIYRSRARRPDYPYQEETINLAEFDSRQLWLLLDEAKRIGLRLLHAGHEVDTSGYLDMCLDVHAEGTLTVTPAFVRDGEHVDIQPVDFIGESGHGIAYTDPGDQLLRLARLANPVPANLQHLVLSGGRFDIPSTEEHRFRSEYYPQLRHLATVISSDDSFTLPEISEPTLVLRADYGAEHELDIDWEWRYQVDDTEFSVPLYSAPGNPGYRDLNAERALRTELERVLGGELDEHAEFTGMDTMRFTTEVVPLLVDQNWVSVEVSGEPAEYHEASDSLRIGISATEVAGKHDWLDLAVNITVEGKKVPFIDIFTALSTDQTHMLLDNGAYFSLDKPELRELHKLITEARSLHEATPDGLRLSRYQVKLWAELVRLGIVDRQSASWKRQVQGLLSPETITEYPIPAALTAQLRPYQTAGFQWLAFLWEYQLGGILADDMGLGKTVQSLALLCHAKAENPALAPFLVVAPTSVVGNWAAESARFAPGLNVVAITETQRRRGIPLSETIAGADLVITSYALFRIDFDAYRAVEWSALIMDEAQFAKNRQSKVYGCARKLETPFKLAITGTPMENNLMELWSMLSITAPGLFPSPTKFAEFYARRIEKGEDPELLNQLRRRVKPLMKRRTKEQVAPDLPSKQEQVLEVELHPRHRKLYQTHLQRERQKILGLVHDMNAHRFTILRSLTLLRQLSLHAGIIDKEQRELPSAKIDALLTQLQDVVEGGHRALVFSQFTGFLHIVRERLIAEGIEYCYLDGATTDRPGVLKDFKEGEAPVFLISLKAGGFGLNLTEADYCFLLDPWWNPATEAQAVDRTHRIGQTRNVMVYRLIAKDTIEEKVMALKNKKAKLFANVIDEGNTFGSALTSEDIRSLLD